MRCCRSDWPGRCLFCCYQPLCVVRQQSLFSAIYCFINCPILPPPPFITTNTFTPVISTINHFHHPRHLNQHHPAFSLLFLKFPNFTPPQTSVRNCGRVAFTFNVENIQPPWFSEPTSGYLTPGEAATLKLSFKPEKPGRQVARIQVGGNLPYVASEPALYGPDSSGSGKLVLFGKRSFLY